MKKLTHRLFGGPCGLGALCPGPPGPLDKTALDETAFHNATQTYKTKTTACKTNFFSSQTGLILRPTVSDHITARCCLWPVGLGLGLRKVNVPYLTLRIGISKTLNVEAVLWMDSAVDVVSAVHTSPWIQILSSDSVGSRIIFLPRVSMHSIQSAILIYYLSPSVRPMLVLCLNDGTYRQTFFFNHPVRLWV